MYYIILGEHNGTKTVVSNQCQKSGPCSSTFCIDNYYCCACIIIVKHQSVIKKSGEPAENDAGFLKVIIAAVHVYVAS